MQKKASSMQKKIKYLFLEYYEDMKAYRLMCLET